MTDPRANPRYDYAGTLKVTTDPETAEELETFCSPDYDGEVPKLFTGQSVDTARYLDGHAIKRTLFAPQIDTSVVEGAVFRPNWGFMDPVELTREFVHRAQEEGVEVQTHSSVSKVVVFDGAVSGVVVNETYHEAENVICAAGPWNVEIAGHLGIDLPVEHTLGPILRLDVPTSSDCNFPVLVSEDTGAFCRQDFDGTFLLGHRPRDPDAPTHYSPSEVPSQVPNELRKRALDSMAKLVPAFEDAEVVDEQVAIRSSVADDRPVVGWTDVEGFSIAAFDSSGIQLSPAVGDILARQLIDGEPTEYYDAVSITRFDGYTDCHDGSASDRHTSP
jgi:glycine/D-amino acid oxidase-like deaminating enzyme